MPSPEKELRILLLEENSVNVRAIEQVLEKNGIRFVIRWVRTDADYLGELQQTVPPELIISGSHSSAYNGFTALGAAKEKLPDVPFVFVNETNDMEVVIAAFREGATDYVLPTQLGTTLTPAVARAMQIAETRRKQREDEKRRQRLMPICSTCKKIRDEKDKWHQLENYLTNFFGIRFTHSICPVCFKTIMDGLEVPQSSS